METSAVPAGEREKLHQFGRPRGWVGGVVGHLMALTNGAMNRAALARLELARGERVLEIGYGPGRTLRKVARYLEGGFVAGLDHSPVMARQAVRRNRRLIRAGPAGRCPPSPSRSRPSASRRSLALPPRRGGCTF